MTKKYMVTKNEWSKKDRKYIMKDYGFMCESDMLQIVKGYAMKLEREGQRFYERKNSMTFFSVVVAE